MHRPLASPLQRPNGSVSVSCCPDFWTLPERHWKCLPGVERLNCVCVCEILRTHSGFCRSHQRNANGSQANSVESIMRFCETPKDRAKPLLDGSAQQRCSSASRMFSTDEVLMEVYTDVPVKHAKCWSWYPGIGLWKKIQESTL